MACSPGLWGVGLGQNLSRARLDKVGGGTAQPSPSNMGVCRQDFTCGSSSAHFTDGETYSGWGGRHGSRMDSAGLQPTLQDTELSVWPHPQPFPPSAGTLTWNHPSGCLNWRPGSSQWGVGLRSQSSYTRRPRWLRGSALWVWPAGRCLSFLICIMGIIIVPPLEGPGEH